MAQELRHSTRREVLPGQFYPLGATLGPGGVNFAIYSQNATDVFVLLFDDPEGDPTDVIRHPQRTRFIWHGLVRGIGAAQIYGLKVRGPHDLPDKY